MLKIAQLHLPQLSPPLTFSLGQPSSVAPGVWTQFWQNWSLFPRPPPLLCPSAPLGLPRLARHPASAAGPAPGQYVLSPALFPVLTYIIPSLLPSLHLALHTRCILSSLVLSTYSSCRIFFVLSSQKLLLLLFSPSRPHVRSLLHPSIFPSPFTGTSAIVLFFFCTLPWSFSIPYFDCAFVVQDKTIGFKVQIDYCTTAM